MLRKNISKIAVISILTFAMSCSSNKQETTPKATGNLSNLPSWVLDPEVENGIAAVGIASPSRGGIRFQIPKAELDAKANIATKIQSDVSRVTKNALRESNVNQINDVEEFFSQASKEVVKDIPLSGIERINMHKDQEGTLYIHMVLKDKDYSKYLKNSREEMKKRLEESNISRANIDNAQKATQSIFNELESERNK